MRNNSGVTKDGTDVTESGENALIGVPEAGYYDETSKISVPIETIKNNVKIGGDIVGTTLWQSIPFMYVDGMTLTVKYNNNNNAGAQYTDGNISFVVNEADDFYIVAAGYSYNQNAYGQIVSSSKGTYSQIYQFGCTGDNNYKFLTVWHFKNVKGTTIVAKGIYFTMGRYYYLLR